MSADRPARRTFRELLFPERPRFFAWARPVQLVLRSLHLAAMALVVGGLPFGADFHALRGAILVTVATGFLLFAIDLAKDLAILTQGSGVAVLVKLGLLGMGLLQPASRLTWYLAATLVASVGSHMPGSWRHFSFLTWKVVRYSE
ncbi:hypothetical protein GETHLI_35030 [Geothrix limicola]|uniref:Uncharacterized protein n=1 Tax=Geothrix limicola TaxID=2927978 RepID=A0ABQ5QL63_9BACT|nr:hypothetical protein GETHLI_35030 [Geothrix limicola]